MYRWGVTDSAEKLDRQFEEIILSLTKNWGWSRAGGLDAREAQTSSF